jgi:hypothetical protein
LSSSSWGGYAVAAHGLPRATKDIVLWVGCSPANAPRVITALKRFGAAVSEISEKDFLQPGITFQIGIPPRRIDIITEIEGVQFQNAYPNRIWHKRSRHQPIGSAGEQESVGPASGSGRCDMVRNTRTETGLMGAKLDFYKTAMRNRAKKGFLGYPVATIAFYGPDDRRATKVALGILFDEDDETRSEINRWFGAKGDIRRDASVFEAIFRLTQSRGVRSIAMPEEILGCPHEEGIDYA